jgi:hypothetical protein
MILYDPKLPERMNFYHKKHFLTNHSFVSGHDSLCTFDQVGQDHAINACSYLIPLCYQFDSYLPHNWF